MKKKQSAIFNLHSYFKGKLSSILFLMLFSVLFVSCGGEKEEAKIPQMDKKYLSESQLFALNRAVEADPDEPENYYQRARVYLDREDNLKAIADIEKAISINPQEGKYYLLKGRILKGLHKYQEALGVLRQAEALRVDNAELKLLLAGLFLETGNTSKAIKYLDEAALLTPFHPEVYYLRGKLSGVQGDTSTAVVNYFIVIHKDTGHVESYKELAGIYFNRKKYDSAMVFVTAGRNYEPEDAYFPYLEGRILQSLNFESAALANYHTAIMLDSTLYGAYNSLGNYWYRKGELDKAAVYFEKELKYQPNSISSAIYLAEIYEKQEKGYLGIPLLERVIKMDSLNKGARISLDRLYNKYPKPEVEEPVKKDTGKGPVVIPQPPVKKDTVKRVPQVKPTVPGVDTASKKSVPKSSGKPKPKTKDTSGENTNLVPLITNPDSSKIEVPKE